MLFGMSTIILKWSYSPDLIIFRYSYIKIGHSEPRVAYKSVAYKRKSVYLTKLTPVQFLQFFQMNNAFLGPQCMFL